MKKEILPDTKPEEPLDDWWIAIDQGSATEAEIDAWILKLDLEQEQKSNDDWFASLIDDKPLVDDRRTLSCIHPFGTH